ncbi:LOW QUALITY PROTEIN: hypothetical protein V2J09_011245 [Rumex salicifolius]
MLFRQSRHAPPLYTTAFVTCRRRPYAADHFSSKVSALISHWKKKQKGEKRGSIEIYEIMSWKSKDLSRLADGIALVFKEIAKAEARDSSFLKTALVSATDASGLTRGKSHEYKYRSKPLQSDAASKDYKVVNASVLMSVDDNAPSPAPSVVLESNTESSLPILGVDDIASTSELHSPVTSGQPISPDAKYNVGEVSDADLPQKSRRRPRERKVPSTPFTRALGFASLGAGLAWGTVQESARRLVYGGMQDNQSSVSSFISEQNAQRLALALCRMRGAALKLGQMLSIQDESLVPPPILAALEMVRQGADVMPKSQLNKVLNAELGADWSSKLRSFDYEPIAAASIGQVHRAVTHDGLHVAMKIQYPGVADSIESDIQNVKLLLDYTKLIPEGLYLDQAMKVAKEELSRECDYILEAKNQQRYREFLVNNDGFYVPIIVEKLSSRKVLTTELVSGVPIDKVKVLDQETRNYVGKKLLELTLMELFTFRFMQTDPNWSNFLFDKNANIINVIDFGAARDFPKSFVDDYLRMVLACANSDKDEVIEMSRRLGFLTGMESEVMLDAHVQAGFIVGLPFAKPGGYDFRATNIAQSVSHLGGKMLKHRLTPPPDEAYSLHRKLSGAFLACIKLGAVVPCREMLMDVYKQYKFDDNEGDLLSSASLT